RNGETSSSELFTRGKAVFQMFPVFSEIIAAPDSVHRPPGFDRREQEPRLAGMDNHGVAVIASGAKERIRLKAEFSFIQVKPRGHALVERNGAHSVVPSSVTLFISPRTAPRSA